MCSSDLGDAEFCAGRLRALDFPLVLLVIIKGQGRDLIALVQQIVEESRAVESAREDEYCFHLRLPPMVLPGISRSYIKETLPGKTILQSGHVKKGAKTCQTRLSRVTRANPEQ